jgi:hypothetical protein
MTQVFLRLTAPASRTPEILQALESIRLSAQLDRDCVRTHLGIEEQDPDVLVYLEEWSTGDALHRRVASPDFRTLLSVLERAAEPPLLEFRDIAGVRGLDYVTSVRRTEPFAEATAAAPASIANEGETPPCS